MVESFTITSIPLIKDRICFCRCVIMNLSKFSELAQCLTMCSTVSMRFSEMWSVSIGFQAHFRGIAQKMRAMYTCRTAFVVFLIRTTCAVCGKEGTPYFNIHEKTCRKHHMFVLAHLLSLCFLYKK